VPVTPFDLAALRRAVEIARHGVGEVEPNPPVGAVLYRGDQILAEGWHAAYGEKHAEVAALDALEGREPVPMDAALAVTLEPCSSIGKQPACTDRLVRSGVRRIVVGEVDPDRRHQGRGIEILRGRGIDVELAPQGPVPADLLSEFRVHLRRQRPYVVLKFATTLDGSWATGDRSRRWISGAPARARVHRLRGHVDAIVVGSQTVIEDDPLLTARPPGPLCPQRIVVDARRRIGAGARLFRTPGLGRVLWITSAGPVPRMENVEQVVLARPHAIAEELLPELLRHGVNRLLLEGGPTITHSFLQDRVVDRAWVFVSPTFASGTTPRLPAPSDFEWAATASVEQAQILGDDAWFKLCWFARG